MSYPSWMKVQVNCEVPSCFDLVDVTDGGIGEGGNDDEFEAILFGEGFFYGTIFISLLNNESTQSL